MRDGSDYPTAGDSASPGPSTRDIPQSYRRVLGQFIRWLAVIFMSTPTTVQAGYEEHDRVRQLTQAGEILPLTAIIEIYRKRYPSGRILEAELEAEHGRYVYELEVVLDNGRVLELEYDAHTGELLEIERED